MLLHLDKRGGGIFLAAHVIDSASLRATRRWRREARRRLPGADGLVFAKAMTAIGSRTSAGFGAGVPDLRRQVLLSAWRDQSSFYEFAADPLIDGLTDAARYSWWALFEIASAHGTHLNATPLASGTDADGPFATLTLGRARPRSLVAFLREGARLGPIIHAAPGLVSAFSAGVPLSGNCTVRIRDSQQSMIDFAYRDTAGHSATARRMPPILREQLNARLRVRDLGGNWSPETMHRERLERLATELAVARRREPVAGSVARP